MNKILKKIRSDSGDSMMISALIGITVILLFFAFVFDLTKGSAVKNDYTAKAQQSSQVAVKTINSNGSMDWRAAEAFTEEYERLRGINGAEGNGACSTHDFGEGDIAAPTYTFTLKSGRGQGSDDTVTWTTSNPSGNIASAPQLDGAKIYRSINVEIKDATPNFMMDMFGMPCQGIGVNVSAISFGSQSDL